SPLQNWCQDSSHRSNLAVTIKGFAEQLVHQGIDHHVPGTRIKREHLLPETTRRDCSQIRNAADVLQHAPTFRIAKQHEVEHRYERCALSAGHHIRGSEVRYHGHAHGSRNRRSLTQLPGAGELTTRVVFSPSLVIECLPVTSDKIEFDPMSLRGRTDCLCVSNPQPPVQPRQLRR